MWMLAEHDRRKADGGRAAALLRSISGDPRSRNQVQPSRTRQTSPPARLTASAARGIRATVIGILLSALLAAIKIIAGVFGYSYALIADGVESMLDIMSSLAVLGSLRIASSPPSREYPYGYGKAEPLGAMVVASALLVAAVGIAVQSVREIMTPHHMPAAFTLGVLVVVVATKEAMFRLLFRAGTAIGSRAVETDAWHHRTDALTSLAAFVGISIALVAGEGYETADDWAALFACGVITYNGVRLLRAALRRCDGRGAAAGGGTASTKPLAQRGGRARHRQMLRAQERSRFVRRHSRAG